MTTDQHFRSLAGAATVHRAYRLLIDTHLPFAERGIVATSVGDTFVLSAGPVDGTPVLLLPGSGSVAASWGVELAELGRTHRVHAIDLPGESGLSMPTRLPLQRGAHARWLHTVAASPEADPAVVVGTSLGGWVALDYAISYPCAVRELVLFSPSGIGPRKIAPLLLAAFLGALGERGRRLALDYLLGPDQPDWTDAYHQDLGALALATFRHFRPRTDPIPTFIDDELRSLPPALTVVLGNQDRMLYSKVAAERLRNLVVGARMELLPGQGHLVATSKFLQHLQTGAAGSDVRSTPPHSPAPHRTDDVDDH
jgi:pimeloyl-ACP methyl ester carboxylesterase